MEGLIKMSDKELKRLYLMQAIEEKRLKQREAALELSLSKRQVKRLYKRYKQAGAKGLISKKRGKPSNNQLSKGLKDQAYSLILKYYIDFGPTFACEKLQEKHFLKISISSVRNIMISNNIWKIKNKKRKSIHQLRNRRSCVGELIQIDASPHDWFEGRSEKCNLISFIDDATGSLMELKFVPSETTWNYMKVAKSYLKNYGRPLAFYSDKHSIFRINNDSLKKERLTQFSRALKDLEITLICANSPQAKGRVERNFRTLQDRLIKELRLAGISNMEDANKFLPSFIEDFNKRFAKVPKSPVNAHRTIDSFDLDRIFTIQETRYLSKNLILQYKNKLYQIKTSRPLYALRKKTVNILEKESGEIIIEYNGKKLDYVMYHEQPYQSEIVPSKLLNDTLNRIKHKKYKPPRNHPWKTFYPRKYSYK